MNLELFFNLMNIIFAFGSNNWLSCVFAICLFCYNIFTKLKEKNLMSLVIDNQKENKSASDRVSFIFKIKFIVYTLISIYGLCFAILYFFDEMEYAESLKIFKENKEY